MSTDTERQLLVSLSRLDELETKVHTNIKSKKEKC